MPQRVHRTFINTYPVEASGWDRDQAFFVEKSELEWNEETGKYLTLSHSLGVGSMVFLRLLQPNSKDSSLPVPYKVEHAGVTPKGQKQFRLSQILLSGTSSDALR